MADAAAPVLRVDDLRVSFPADRSRVEVLHGLSFALRRERLAIVGESGSGKSMTARAILNLLPSTGRLSAKAIKLGDLDLMSLSPRAWRGVRGKAIGFIPQDPKFSLNPSLTIGRQVAEGLVLHTRLSTAERRDRSLAMLDAVGFADPARIAAARPFELSGGMGQRAMVAAMLINRPQLVIADEPTSALDHASRDRVLGLIGRLTEESGSALILISHDLQQVARFADRVLVMQGGRIVDECQALDLAHATHPYTSALWGAHPSAATYGTRLPVMVRDEGSRAP